MKIYTDGATDGHNGTLGTVSKVGIGVYIPEINFSAYDYVDGLSNNEAEFKALIWAMEIALKKGIEEVDFFLDSQIVVNRANGARPKKEKFKNERMDAFQDEVFKLRINFRRVTFTWIDRERNAKADYLSKQAIAEKTKRMPETLFDGVKVKQTKGISKSKHLNNFGCNVCSYEEDHDNNIVEIIIGGMSIRLCEKHAKELKEIL